MKERMTKRDAALWVQDELATVHHRNWPDQDGKIVESLENFGFSFDEAEDIWYNWVEIIWEKNK